MMQAASEFLQNIPLHILQSVSKLDLRIPSQNNNAAIIDLLHRTTLMGGKRFRPLLTFLMSDFFNIPLSNISPYARAIEMVHAASLAHDDVIDGATSRRGKASINVAASNKKAILAGDYLLADVIVDICGLGHLDLVAELSKVIKDLADGEWLQLESGRRKNLSWDYIELVALKKTASVMSWCCVAPALLAGADTTVVELARNFGTQLGLAFQLIDDTIDFTSSSSTSGKDECLDWHNGVVNAVSLQVLLSRPELFTHLHGDEFIQNVQLPENKIWTQDIIASAVLQVRARALDKIAQAQHSLTQICELFPFPHPQQSERALGTLEYLLKYLTQRKK